MSRDSLGSSFSDKQFDFIITNDPCFQCAKGTASFSFGEWSMSCSATTPVTSFKAAAQITYYFIGTIFEIDKELPINSIGHYVGVEYNQSNKTLRLFRSRNSFLGIYYANVEKVFMFWGNFLEAKNLTKCVVSSETVENFFAEGIITDGHTLFEGIHQVGFQNQLLLANNRLTEEQEAHLKSESPLTLKPSEFLEFTMERFAQWFKYTNYKSLAISGGADSRLLLATLQTHPVENDFSIHSRCHPQLSADQDSDVLIARTATKFLQKEHLLQISQGFPSAYLSQEFPASPPIMSGLYGGEILGGELLRLVSKSRLSTRHEDSFARALKSCAQMFLCDFYHGAWSLCSNHHNLTLTPYWDSYFIAAMLQTPTDVIKDYSYLSAMYQHLPERLREVPFVSQLPQYHSIWEKPLPGVNPKSLSSVAATKPPPKEWLKYKKTLPEKEFVARAVTLRFYLQAFYGDSVEELLSLL